MIRARRAGPLRMAVRAPIPATSPRIRATPPTRRAVLFGGESRFLLSQEVTVGTAVVVVNATSGDEFGNYPGILGNKRSGVADERPLMHGEIDGTLIRCSMAANRIDGAAGDEFAPLVQYKVVGCLPLDPWDTGGIFWIGAATDITMTATTGWVGHLAEVLIYD